MASSASFNGRLRTLAGAPSRNSKTTTSKPSLYAAETGKLVGTLDRLHEVLTNSIVRMRVNRREATSIM